MKWSRTLDLSMASAKLDHIMMAGHKRYLIAIEKKSTGWWGLVKEYHIINSQADVAARPCPWPEQSDPTWIH